MSAYRYAVKVRKVGRSVWRWRWDCPACERWEASRARRRVYRWATHHAATCEALHWANWDAACRWCRRYGRVAPACPVCLGYGYEREREGLT